MKLMHRILTTWKIRELIQMPIKLLRPRNSSLDASFSQDPTAKIQQRAKKTDIREGKLFITTLVERRGRKQAYQVKY
jgi:hypothetical protein